MYRILLILFVFSISTQLIGQRDRDSETLYIIPDEYSSIHHEGEQALLQMKFSEALRHFKKVLKKYPDFPPALRSAGACFELMGDFEKAKTYYESALTANPYFSRAMYFEIGSMNYKSGQYKVALEYFEKYDSLLQEDPQQFTYNGFEEKKIEERYTSMLDATTRACHIALDSIKFWNISEVINLGNGINTKNHEYFPFVTNDGSKIFYTTRKDEFHDEDLLVSENRVGRWSSGEQVKGFNTNENEGMTTFVRDGQTFYFTACQRETVLGTCDVWQGTLVENTAIALSPISGLANSNEWESQASISCDGSVLYFASTREGGQGGTDIWVSQKMPNGNWGEPQNLGNNINTPGDEESPFITNDGNVLYFSSTGHIGLGEQDIYMSRRLEEDIWSDPINLGMPVNSAFRELGFFLSADGKTGYFASDRSGGFGGMDIYRFELPDVLTGESVTYVEGFVFDSITHQPIQTNIALTARSIVQTDENGRFFLCVKADETLNIKIQHKNYHDYTCSSRIPEWQNETFYRLDLKLDPLFKLPVYQEPKNENATLVSLNNEVGKTMRHSVLFDFDKALLKVESIKELERFINEVTKDMEVQDVEVIGFADAIGNDKYNYLLSEQRAKEVGVFLKEKGMEVSKVYIEGKGESNNNLPDWQNRKVEVVVHLAQ